MVNNDKFLQHLSDIYCGLGFPYHLIVKTEISCGIAVLFPPAISGNNLKPSFSKILFPWSETRNLTNCVAPSEFLILFGMVTSNTIGLPKFKVPSCCVQPACL